jgi:predicted transcriptional regulator
LSHGIPDVINWRREEEQGLGLCARRLKEKAAETVTPLVLGSALRRWRLLHRVKQGHAAELFGVAQSTISRWEAGRQAMEPTERAKVEALVSARGLTRPLTGILLR